MKIYLAARFSRKEEMAEFARRLESVGHVITSSWVFGGEEGLTLPEVSDLDLNDVLRADMVLSWTEALGSYNRGGGRHTEFGIALALGKYNWLVGEREQIFHHDERVRAFAHLDDVILALKEEGSKGAGSTNDYKDVKSIPASLLTKKAAA